MREIPQDLVKPDYNRSVVNLSCWVLENFGLEAPHSPLDLPKGFEKVVILIVDALGLENFEKMERYYKPRNLPQPLEITSTFPSTTTTALTSIVTALLPAEHGMLGYILFLKEYGFLVNMIDLSPIGYSRDLLKDRMAFRLPVETVFQRLRRNGTSPVVLTPARYTGSGLSNMLHAGARVVGYTSIGDFVVKLRSLMRGEGKRAIYAYVPNVDGVGHRESERSYLNEAAMIVREIDNVVIPAIPEKTAFILTADHGMIRTPKEKEIWWDMRSEIMEFLEMPPGGERRMMHLYTRDPDRLIEYLEESYGDKGVFLKKDEAVPLFGGGHERIGDVVLIALENFSFNFRYRFQEDSLKGMHGGLSSTEMRVPLFFIGR